MAETFDVALWIKPTYTLVEAAYLICNKMPVRPNKLALSHRDPADVESIGTRLLTELSDCITVITKDRRVVGMDSFNRQTAYTAKDVTGRILKREDVRAWCEANGLRPLFLFPDEPRPATDTDPEKLLQIIAVFAELHFSPNAETYRWGGKPNASALAKALIAKAAELGIEDFPDDQVLRKKLAEIQKLIKAKTVF